ncbi:MAG: fatty acyl-AMP ligase, partial [Myxococcota bacterium]
SPLKTALTGLHGEGICPAILLGKVAFEPMRATGESQLMSRTLIDVLDQAASVEDRGYTFLDNDLAPHDWSFTQLAREAERRARYFLSLGYQKGDRIAMVVPDGEDFVLNFLGVIRAGLVPVPMYPPLALGKIDSYLDAASRIIRTAGVKVLITTKQVSPILWSLLGRSDGLQDILLTDKIRDHDERAVGGSLAHVAVSPEDPCFLQFTSGSTSDPKGVVVTHANLVANAKAIMIDGLNSDPSIDRGVSWLPLYHDMGLIGFVVAPLLNQVPVVFIPTLSFVKRPSVWLDTIDKYRGTITFGPNFALGLASKRTNQAKLAKMDLSCLRVLGCGAEPINPVTMRTFIETFEKAGLNPNAIMPAYGMAEATLAIAFDSLQRPMTTLRIDRERYEADQIAVPLPEGSDESQTLELVSCGQTFPQHEIAIIGGQGQRLAEGQVGEIVLRGPSTTGGYFENKEATESLLKGGWLHTGDLGFILEGQLYVSGRQKDLIILNGRNYYPQAIEWEVEQVPGVRKGNVAAFSVPGATTEELVIAAETKSQDHEALAQAIIAHLKTSIGVRCRDVKLVGSGQLPKTSSGKIQRRRTKHLYEKQSLGVEGNRTLGSTATKVTLAKHVTYGALIRLRKSITKPARRMFRTARRA